MVDSPDFDVLDAREAAKYLKINEQTLRRLARDKEIPSFKVGGSWRFRKSSLERWARSQERRIDTQRVLVVDDEEPVRRLLRRVLEAEGYAVETATGGKEAVQAMQRQLPDLLLLDLMMPEMDGVEVLQVVRKSYGALPVIVLTGFPDSALMEKALEFSPFTVLAKPSSPEKVVETVRGILQGSGSGEAAASF